MLSQEEIKKEIVIHYLNYLDSLKSLLESNDKIADAYENGQRQDILEAADEVVKEIKEKYNIIE